MVPVHVAQTRYTQISAGMGFCNLLSDVQMNLSDKPDGTISCINVEIQRVKFIQDYLHFDFKSPDCELCPHDHSYVILAGLMNDSSVSDVLPYIMC